MVSEHSNLKDTEEIYIRVRVRIIELVRVIELELDLKLKNLPTKKLN